MLQELKSGKEQELLENFLATREVPQRAAEEAKSLKIQTGKKWGDRNVGKVTVPAHWIDKIMENIQRFIEIGSFVMEGAPESAGLAWLAVRLTLSAIQGNYELYSLFGTGLTDITEIMVLIPHYDQLYNNGSKMLHTNVEVLVWKPPRLEVIASETGVPHTTFAPQGGDVHLELTPQHLVEIIN